MTGNVDLIRSRELFPHAPYAYAATAPADARLIFLAGACPIDPDGATVAIGDYAGQARACIDNMIIALREAGATLEDVIRHPGAGRLVPTRGPHDSLDSRPGRVR